jgi:hypothetical protein
LPEEVFVDSRRNVFVVDALHQGGHAAGDFNILNPALQLTLRFRQSLAALNSDRSSQVGDIVVQQRLETKQILNALSDRGAPPPIVGPRRGFDGIIHILIRRLRHLGNYFARGGIR